MGVAAMSFRIGRANLGLAETARLMANAEDREFLAPSQRRKSQALAFHCVTTLPRRDCANER
jgi:hypothetical protein